MMFLTKLLRIVGILPALIVGVENLFGSKTGEQKRGAVISVIVEALGIAEAIANRDIVDEEKFKESLVQVINGIVGMLNASVWRK